MTTELLITVGPELYRIALVVDGVLQRLVAEPSSQGRLGNIYKGRIVNIESAIQASFVDIGIGINGFLHVSDVEPAYHRHLTPPRRNREERSDARYGPDRFKPLIQDVFKRGQEVLVQIIRDGIGGKGPTLSTYVSLAGVHLVLMPNLDRIGVSRKIADEEERRRLRELFDGLDRPRGLGFVVRTSALGADAEVLQEDLQDLVRLWSAVARRVRRERAPALIYAEPDALLAAVRDQSTLGVDTIRIDDAEACERARGFMEILRPQDAPRIQFYSEKEPLFQKYGINQG
jgi:ribonuclease E